MKALEDGVGDGAHEVADLVGLQDGAAVFDGRGCDGLIHDGERVAHGAVTGFGEQGESCVFSDDFFVLGDGFELGEDVVELDGVEAEVLAAGADGLGNALGLGGGHHEDGPLGRLLECFEDGVEGRVGDLVGFVEEEDFVLVAGRADIGLRTNGPDVVDAAVGGGVDLDEVEGVGGCVVAAGVASGGDFAAGDAVEAGLDGGAGLGSDFGAAIEGHGQDAGDGGFADAAVAGKDVAVGDALLGEGVDEGAGDVVLAGYIRKALRTVFACQYLVSHARVAPRWIVKAGGRGGICRGGGKGGCLRFSMPLGLLERLWDLGLR